jgi:transforming growth factor-beta-induced protein
LSLAALPAAAQEPTIAEIVVNSAAGDPAEFTILLAAVQAADPSILAALSDPNASLTVFAPTDEAFEDLFAELGLTADEVLADTALLNDVLSYHVLSGEYDSAALFAAANSDWPGTYIQTLQGTYLEFTDDEGSLIVDDAWVSAADIQASNGVVLVINKVLLPSYNYGEEGLPAVS